MEDAGGLVCNGQPVMAEELPEGEITVLRLVRQVGYSKALLYCTLQIVYSCNLMYSLGGVQLNSTLLYRYCTAVP